MTVAPSQQTRWRRVVDADLTLSVGTVIPTHTNDVTPIKPDNPVCVIDAVHGISCSGKVIRSYPDCVDGGWWVDVAIQPNTRRPWHGDDTTSGDDESMEP